MVNTLVWASNDYSWQSYLWPVIQFEFIAIVPWVLEEEEPVTAMHSPLQCAVLFKAAPSRR